MAAQAAEVNLDTGGAAVKGGGMPQERVKPEACASMADVRQGVDGLDEQIETALAGAGSSGVRGAVIFGRVHDEP